MIHFSSSKTDNIGENLIFVSLYSASGSDSPIIPHPANKDMLSPLTSPDRILTANSPFRLLSNQPSGAPYQPLSNNSFSRINLSDSSLGTPPNAGVGCNVWTISVIQTPFFNVALTGVYKCCKCFNG